MFAEIVYLTLNIFLIALIVVFTYGLIWSRRAPPFIPVPKDVVPLVMETLGLKSGEIFYDLGSGDGRIVFGAKQNQPNADCRGVEYNRMVYWFSLWKRKKLKLDGVKLMRKSFYKISVSDADAIFTYLYPKTMDLLLPKLEEELKPGGRVVSVDFEFSKKAPSEVIEIKGRDRKLGRRILVYRF